MTQKPRANKSKEEILADLKNNADFQRKMQFTREVFYPALCNASTSIDDAVILLSGLNTQIMQEFLASMKEKTVKDLQLDGKLDKDNPKYAESQVLLAIFNDMTVFDAKDHIEGMRGEIQLFLTEEQKKRPLSDLATKWLEDYANEVH